MNKLIPNAATYTAKLTQSTLPYSVSGQENQINFREMPPIPIIKAIQEGDVIARLGCAAQDGEYVLILKGTFQTSTLGAKIYRGYSGYYDGSIGEALDFTKSQELYLKFGNYVNPYALQQLWDNMVSVLEKTDVPVGNTQVAGIIKTAYKEAGTENIASKAITSDSPALIELYRAVFGVNTFANDTQTLTTQEMARIGILADMLNYFALSPDKFEHLKKFLNLLTDINLRKNFFDFLDQIKNDNKYKKLKTFLDS